ncbi:MAG: hypothetical protein COB53_03960 [Elusimicrobia bacterium]|nr:MAG: hypothetical protein COB53_03960 [Elusimicrobiota bacterium]
MALKVPKGCIEETDARVSKSGHPAPAWLWPYSDLMTELVAFFVILYALSAALDPTATGAAEETKEAIEAGEIAGEVEIDKSGLHITLAELENGGSFESGYADLTPAMTTVLDRMAPILRPLVQKGQPLIIEGHTDNLPIKNDYFWGNWELSTARATMVVEYLIDRKGFPPGCMGAIGYGHHRPLGPNKTRKERRKNRRVVIFARSGDKTDSCPDTRPKKKSEPKPEAKPKSKGH